MLASRAFGTGLRRLRDFDRGRGRTSVQVQEGLKLTILIRLENSNDLHRTLLAISSETRARIRLLTPRGEPLRQDIF